jgi:NADPH:quinone reductase-like Zn-dependent oxidoreductase
MKAARIHDFGGPEVLHLEEIELPAPGPDDLLIQVIASGINPVEYKVRQGFMAGVTGRPLPLTLGWDLAGIVTSVGDAVTGFKRGDYVFAFNALGQDGCHAEAVIIPAKFVAQKPEGLSFEEAAAVPMTAETAAAIIDASKIQPGERMLIHGAGGAVGHWLIQMAKQAGAHVIATASERDMDRVRQLGADEVIDYRRERFETRVSDIDIVVDLVGGETQRLSWDVLAENGRMLSTVPGGPSLGEPQPQFIFTQPDGTVLARIARMIDYGVLKPLPIAAEFPLRHIRRAHEQAESGAVHGKIVLRVA